ncbi:ABC transporter substrate-binding protein [Candidatus Uabimicrobium amorphum]|uniref:Putrescine-binding periplasmic protein n=2 Tax=Uabimicrobium amorphum TaxID=2596890 RepID=A0A5S9IPH5_UABAM|nr:putrescine-binding periplasmic protein [Candidatus Uabimicrobium amorphum]
MYKWIITLLTLLFLIGCDSKPKEVLNVYNWSEYMPEDVIEQFEKETGIKVYYSTYDSNEAMYAKVKLLESGGYYDIVVPSAYFIDRLRKEQLLHKLDHNKLKNWKNLDPLFLNKEHDPNNSYSIPYLWGTSGIAVNTQRIKDPITKWQDLWNPKFKNKVLLLNDVRDTFAMTLTLLGYSINTKDEQHIKEAYEKLKELKNNVRVFNSESPKQPFINQEVEIGMIYNGEAVMAQRENNNIKYIYPQEGVILWVDNLAILKNAKNLQNAYKFVDFLLRPEIAKRICEEIGYASPNKEAKQLLEEKIRNNTAIYPSKEIIEKATIPTDIGDTIRIYQKYWEKLKSEN